MPDSPPATSPRNSTPSRLAMVTGASSGIGTTTAELLAARGWKVVLVGRRREALAEVAARIGASGGAAVVEAVDLAQAPAALELAQRVRREHGVPDVIVHSAGAGAWKYLEETPPAEMQEMMGAPFFAAYHLIYAFMGDMLARRSGQHILINSPSCQMPFPGTTGYTAARHALRGLHEALRVDLAGTGVRSSHLVLGPVKTPYLEKHPGSAEKMPLTALFLGNLTTEQCARGVLRLIDRPRPELRLPFQMRLFYWTDALFPALARWLAVRTGFRRNRAPMLSPGSERL